jgi:hypothetical protein
MSVNLSEEYSEELADMLREVEPADFPFGDIKAAWEGGNLHFLTVRKDGQLVGLLAYDVSQDDDGQITFEVVGLNANRAPLALRIMFQQVAARADLNDARLSCMIERPAMGRIVERFGLSERAKLYVKEPAHVL